MFYLPLMERRQMDALRGLDIDNEDDLVLAQALASHSTFMNKCN